MKKAGIVLMEKSYLFLLDYGNRIKEKHFIKEILNRYDNNKLVGVGLYVNNNPYNLKFFLHLNFNGETEDFENWLNTNFSSKKRVFNYFHNDMFLSMSTRGYNVATLLDVHSVDVAITAEPNAIFLFPDKSTMDNLWNTNILDENLSVFLSHSSGDKKIVDKIFNELQLNEIKAWYDKYEIRPGDSITDKINDGLDKSDIGIICVSKNFFNSSTGWTKSELNYFIQRRMRSNKADFICVNFDLHHSELPPLLQDYRYIDFNEPDAIEVLISTLKEKSDEFKKIHA